ncbi:uncharacterized protein cyp7b1 isoform X4 [Vanacampus margaritifer]
MFPPPACALLLVAVAFVLVVISRRRRKSGAGEPPLINGWIPFLGKALEFRKDAHKFLEEQQKNFGDVFTVHIAGPPEAGQRLAHAGPLRLLPGPDVRGQPPDLVRPAGRRPPARRRGAAPSPLRPIRRGLPAAHRSGSRPAAGRHPRRAAEADRLLGAAQDVGLDGGLAVHPAPGPALGAAPGPGPWRQSSAPPGHAVGVGGQHGAGRLLGGVPPPEASGGAARRPPGDPRCAAAQRTPFQRQRRPGADRAAAGPHDPSGERRPREPASVLVLHQHPRRSGGPDAASHRRARRGGEERRHRGAVPAQRAHGRRRLRPAAGSARSPHTFRFDRFAGKTEFFKDGQKLRHYLMPFGSGASICPGRFFAVNEIKQFVCLLLLYFELRLEAGQPDARPDASRAGLGIPRPARDVSFCYRARGAAS